MRNQTMGRCMALPIMGFLLAGGFAFAEPQKLPVTRVVLYSSGVGYFEHAGEIQGSTSVNMMFKTDQINDILKSLIIEDLDGGRVGTVAYPSRDPISKTLQSFQVNLAEDPSLSMLLAQLRGADVLVHIGAEKIEGRILGLEKRQKSISDDGTPLEVPVLNILSNSTVQAVVLEEVRQIQLKDPALEKELGKALDTLAGSRNQEKKPLTLTFQGDGKRRIRAGYLVETPIWKTSYRLVLPSEKEAQGFLQGWAIIENQTDNDWEGVNLSLVSGRPISFIQDLYQPIYVPRQVYQPRDEAFLLNLSRKVLDDKMERGSAMMRKSKGDGVIVGSAPMAPGEEQMAGRPRKPLSESLQGISRTDSDSFGPSESLAAGMSAGYGGMMGAPPASAPPEPIDIASSVSAAAMAGEVGELFQYQIGSVDLPRQRSAMLPIVTDKTKVERLSLYNQSVLADHPLLGARVTNTTGKHLQQGPITVFDEGSYAGDSRIENLPGSQHALLSFGIDQMVKVQAAHVSQESRIMTGKIYNGVLEITNKRIASQDYVIQNHDKKDREILIEHPVRPGWNLANGLTPIEKTETLYRFSVPVVSGSTKTLTVKQEIIESQTIALIPADIGILEVYSQQGEIPQPIRTALAKAFEMRKSLMELERQLSTRGEKIAAITEEQKRIRENMTAGIDKQSEYYTRLLTKLNQQETEIEQIQAEMTRLQADIETQRKALEDYILKLDLQ